MSLLNNPNDYSGLSHQELRAALVQDILKTLPGFSDASASGIILNTLASIFDYTNFYHSIRGRESLMNTAELYSSIIGHSENLNYVPKRKRSSIGSVTLKFTKNNKSTLENIRTRMLFVIQNNPDKDYSVLVFKIKPKRLKLTFQGLDYINPFEHTYFLDVAAISKLISDLEINDSVEFIPQSFNTDFDVSYIDVYQASEKTISNINFQLGSSNTSDYSIITYGNSYNNLGSFSEIIFNDLDISEYYAESDFGSKQSGLGVKSFDNNFTRLSYGVGTDKTDLTLSKDYITYVNNDSEGKLNNVICGMKPDKKFYVKFGNSETYITPFSSSNNVISGRTFEFKYYTTNGSEANNYACIGQNMTLVSPINQTSNFAYLVEDNFDSVLQAQQSEGSSAAGDGLLNSYINELFSTCEYVLKTNIIGGMDFESIEEIKQSAPTSFSRRNRLVSKSDYKSFLESYDYPINVNTAKVWGEMEEIISYNSQLSSGSGIFAKKTAHNIIFYSLIGYIYNQDGTKNDMQTTTGQYRAYLLNKHEESLDILKNVIISYYIKDDVNKVISLYNSTSSEIKPAVELTETLEDIGIMGSRPLYIPSWRHSFDLILQKNVGNNVSKIDEDLVKKAIYSYFAQNQKKFTSYNTYEIVSYITKEFPEYGNFIRSARFKSSKSNKQWQDEIKNITGFDNPFHTDPLFSSNNSTNKTELSNYIDTMIEQIKSQLQTVSTPTDSIAALKTIPITLYYQNEVVYSGNVGTILSALLVVQNRLANTTANSIYNIIYPSTTGLYSLSIDALYRTTYGIVRTVKINTGVSSNKITITEEIYNYLAAMFNNIFASTPDSNQIFSGSIPWLTYGSLKTFSEDISLNTNDMYSILTFSAILNLLLYKHIGLNTTIKQFDVSVNSIVNNITFNRNMTLRNMFKVLHDLAFACDFNLTSPTQSPTDRLTLTIPKGPGEPNAVEFDFLVSDIKSSLINVFDSTINDIDNVYVNILNSFEPQIKENILINPNYNGTESMEYTQIYSSLDGWSCDFEIPDITVKFI